MLILTLSRSNSKCSDSDLSCLRNPEKWVGDNPINSFLGLISAHRQDSFCLSSFFYFKLSSTLRESQTQAEREAGLDNLCRWIPRGDLKKNIFAPINIKQYHWTFVHAVLESSNRKINQGTKAVKPGLIYYDSYRGNLEGCLDDFEVFFHHLARKRNRPDLGVAWEKKNGKAPLQHDKTHCCSLSALALTVYPLASVQQDMGPPQCQHSEQS
jgi:Ulp1 family protease